MSCFLLNELGEVLLEIKSGLGFGADMRLEVNESAQSAVLRSAAESFAIDFVHAAVEKKPLSVCRGKK